MGNWLYAPSNFWNMKYLGKRHFRTVLPLTFDLEMEVQILLAVGSMVQSPEVLVSYRRHAVSLSSAGKKDLKRFLEEAALYEELADLFEASRYPRAIWIRQEILLKERDATNHSLSIFNQGGGVSLAMADKSFFSRRVSIGCQKSWWW